MNLGYGPLLNSPKAFTLFAGLTLQAASKPVGVSLQARYGSLRAVNLPADYSPGLTVLGDGIPSDDFFTAGITGVWFVRPFARVPSLRLRLEAGPAYMLYVQNEFTRTPPSGGWFSFSLGSNYQSSIRSQPALGVEGAVRVEGLDRRFGVSGGLWGHANTAFQAVGVDLAVLLGRLR